MFPLQRLHKSVIRMPLNSQRLLLYSAFVEAGPSPPPQRMALTAQRHMAYHVLGPTCALLSAILPGTSSLNYQHFVQHPPILHINICQLSVEYEEMKARAMLKYRRKHGLRRATMQPCSCMASRGAPSPG